MRLVEAVENLDKLDQDATIFARRPWTGESECTLVELSEMFDKPMPKRVKAAGFEYFLEVDTAREILGVFGRRKPTLDEKLRLILFYAERDAFPDWVRR